MLEILATIGALAGGIGALLTGIANLIKAFKPENE